VINDNSLDTLSRDAEGVYSRQPEVQTDLRLSAKLGNVTPLYKAENEAVRVFDAEHARSASETVFERFDYLDPPRRHLVVVAVDVRLVQFDK
jgi:hypothetical protein